VLALSSPENHGLDLVGQVAKGQREAHLSVQVGRDHDPGTYHTAYLTLVRCPGYDKNIAMQPPAAADVSVTVRAIPDPTVFPSGAGTTLSVTQKQFFDTKIDELRRLDQRITTAIAGKDADQLQLRQFLIQIILEANHDLSITADQYAGKISKPGEPLPPFFAEFHQRYAELIIAKLKASPPDIRHTSGPSQPKIIYVEQQLKQRQEAAPELPPHNSTGFPPSIVTDSEDTIKDNVGMYAYNRDTGRHNCDIDIRSNPTGARVSYKMKIKDEYMPLPGHTDIQKMTLEMVSWDFMFHLDGCPDQFYADNPYNEQVHEASVEFPRNCHRSR
jgi:hypothetical protein